MLVFCSKLIGVFLMRIGLIVVEKYGNEMIVIFIKVVLVEWSVLICDLKWGVRDVSMKK